MKPARKCIIDSDTLVIQVGEFLDFSLSDKFFQACHCAQVSKVKKIVVDFARTCSFHESGLTLLMMLHDRAWYLRGGIELVNCNPTLRRELNRQVYPDVFIMA